jgi:hypothetical protein
VLLYIYPLFYWNPIILNFLFEFQKIHGEGVRGLGRDPRQFLKIAHQFFFEILTIHFHPTATTTPPVQINIKQ